MTIISEAIPQERVLGSQGVRVRVRAWARGRDTRPAAGVNGEALDRSDPRAGFDAGALLRGVVSDTPGVYALTARGHGMRDALINDGDVVLLQPCQSAAEGELVAVRLPGRTGVVLRRLYFQGAVVQLQPENQRLRPELLARGEVTVEARVIAIARQNPAHRVSPMP